jgi:2-hydroxychromene-2-carboxylate isomerase
LRLDPNSTRRKRLQCSPSWHISRSTKEESDAVTDATNPAALEMFFDLSSPWTYIAFTNLDGLLARNGATAHYRPILVGGVFNAVNPAVYVSREQADSPRIKHSYKVMHDWARLAGLDLRFPSQWHPAKSVNAMRMATAIGEDQAGLKAFAAQAFAAYFLREENLDDPAVLVEAANAAGLEGAAIWEAAQSAAVKQALRDTTDELIARDGYGSPTFFVGGTDMYFGNDQLPLVEAALERISR